jgi:hypothetical protein
MNSGRPGDTPIIARRRRPGNCSRRGYEPHQYEIRESGRNEIVTLNYDRLIDSWETVRAWCFLFGDKTIYLPKSLVEDIRESANEVEVPRWLVEAEGLEGYVI